MKPSIFNGKTIAIFVAVTALGYMVGVSLVDDPDHDHEHENEFSMTSLQTLKEPVKAIDFVLPSLDGGTVALESLRGKWVLINFWAIWCGPCVLEMPMMNRMYGKLKGKPFEILAVNIENAPVEKIHRFADDLDLKFTILLDRDKSIASKYEIMGLPYSVLVDPDGRLIAHAYGMREWDRPEMISYFIELMKTAPKQKAGA